MLSSSSRACFSSSGSSSSASSRSSGSRERLLVLFDASCRPRAIAETPGSTGSSSLRSLLSCCSCWWSRARAGEQSSFSSSLNGARRFELLDGEHDRAWPDQAARP